MFDFSDNNVRQEKILKRLFSRSKTVCIFFALFFFVSQVLGIQLFVGTDAIGQYGDFVGGVVGTILSVILLYFTFKSQILESKNNAKVFVSQQFNDTFFHLFEQYNHLVHSFHVEFGEDDKGPVLEGKEAMHYCLEKMRKDFVEENVNNGRKVAVAYFTNYLSFHIDFFPIYYRHLYRILCLIDNSGITEKEKVKYAKIIRSQLTDTELIMMRYNAMTPLGKNMITYINEFNLLKHLPPLEMLEFGKWRCIFTDENRNRANIILVAIKKNFHELYCCDKQTLAFTGLKAKYNINVSKNNNGTCYKLDFNRRVNLITSTSDVFCCFDSIVLNDIIGLFYDWLFEIFVVTNFQKYNGLIKIVKNITPLQNHNEHFTLTITRKDHATLKLSGK